MSETNGTLNGVAEPKTGEVERTELLTQERLRQITEARANVREVRELSRAKLYAGETTADGADIIYREAVASFLSELRPYRKADPEAEAYWTGPEDNYIGTVVVHPPDGFDDAEPKEVALIHGLNDVMRAPVTFSAEFERRVSTPCGADVTKTETATTTIPRQILDRAVDWACDFAHAVGLDLDVDDGASVYGEDTEDWR